MAATSSSREFISIHLGSAGVQIGSACWELFCLEHGIQPDGTMVALASDGDDAARGGSLFYETRAGKAVPRAVFADTEPATIDEMRLGAARECFDREQLVSGDASAAGSYARARYAVGARLADVLLDRIRKQADNCSNLQGFVLFHAVGGATGSGVGSLVLERLGEDYAKALKFEFAVYPTPASGTRALETVNAVLATHATREHADCSFMFANGALSGMCHRGAGVDQPPLTLVNRLVARIVGSVTAPLRYNERAMSEFPATLVPYSQARYLVQSYAPLGRASESATDETLLVPDLTTQLVDTTSQTIGCDVRTGKCLASVIVMRGVDVAPKLVSQAKAHVSSRRLLHFVDWMPQCLHAWGHNRALMDVQGDDLGPSPRLAMCMMANTTAVGPVWTRMGATFDASIADRALVASFVGDGMEQSEFGQAREFLTELEADYVELAESASDDDGNNDGEDGLEDGGDDDNDNDDNADASS